MRSEWLRGRREEMIEIRKGCDVGHRRGKSVSSECLWVRREAIKKEGKSPPVLV